MRARKLEEKTVSKFKFFDLKKQTIVDKNKTLTYDFIERKSIVVVFPLSSSGEIYLLSQYRTLFNKTVTEAVAGHIDEGEDVLEAAKRELREEAGIIAGQWDEFLKLDESASVIRANIYFFLAKDLQVLNPEPEEDEEIEVIKMPLEKAIKMVEGKQITTMSTTVGLLFLDKLRKEKKI